MIRSLFVIMVVSFLGVVPGLATDFNHTEHLTYIDDASCTACHVEGAVTIKPSTSVCVDCHDEDFVKEVKFSGLKTHGPVWALNHRPFAKGSAVDCSACHQQDYCLECHKSGRADEMGALGNNMINVHRSDFHVTHPIAARNDPQRCNSCHESRFCTDCHTEFQSGRSSGPSHRRTFDLGLNESFSQITEVHKSIPDGTSCDTCHSPDTVAPDFHAWSSGHAREARKNLATCQACHPDGDVCIKCHSATGGVGSFSKFNPHGKGWSKRAGRLSDASNGETCKKCH